MAGYERPLAQKPGKDEPTKTCTSPSAIGTARRSPQHFLVFSMVTVANMYPKPLRHDFPITSAAHLKNRTCGHPKEKESKLSQGRSWILTECSNQIVRIRR